MCAEGHTIPLAFLEVRFPYFLFLLIALLVPFIIGFCFFLFSFHGSYLKVEVSRRIYEARDFDAASAERLPRSLSSAEWIIRVVSGPWPPFGLARSAPGNSGICACGKSEGGRPATSPLSCPKGPGRTDNSGDRWTACTLIYAAKAPTPRG